MTLGLILLAAALSAWILTSVVRRYALASSMIDVPMERSSHTVPTPRGGGLAVVLSFMLGGAALVSVLEELWQPVLATAGAGAIVALIGFVDDHRDLSVRLRLLAHFGAAGCGLWLLGGVPDELVPTDSWMFKALLNVVFVIGLVWLLNLYNFMDGIDALASAQAICAGTGGAILALVSGQHLSSPAVFLPLLLAASVAGFLPWNLPPARIFMGDVCSGFLGIVVGLLALLASHAETSLLYGWAILLAVFVTDATLTLVRRALRGERIHLPHRSHAYQHAARHLGGHGPVSIIVAGICVLWLLPLALLAVLGVLPDWLAVVTAYLPLIALALRLGAGEPG